MRLLKMLLGAAWLALALAAPGHAQDYPARPVTLVVGFAPGGNADIVARLVAQHLGTALGQQVVVENRGGAGGMLASEQVAKAPADGYRLLLVSGAFPTQAAVMPKLPFDPVKDFTPVSMVISYPLVVTVQSESPFRTLDELVRHAKANPRKLNYPSPGNGSLFHLATEVFGATAGLEMTHVPFKGGSQPLTELLAGRLDVMFDTLSVVQPQLQAGKLRALAVTSPRRMQQLPNVPAVAETVPGYEAGSFLAIAGPAGLPPPVVERLNAAVRRVVALPDVRQRFTDLGGEPVAGSPQEMATHVATAIDRWKAIVKARDIKPE
ncbi:MAG TPA: tripartite tricarboxylate transporter substrate binding protein [Ramlibacter sp.]|nr:tripartite tricarboxylate transporter substrate binding protein [Ramlibacter sp.]